MSRRTRSQQLPVALTIAGSDSGGGAGIQADLKTFAALRVHGTSAITCITAQNPRGVSGVHPCPPAMLRSQIEAVFKELPPSALKTGMLYSSAIITEVCDFLKTHPCERLVVDPVMVATSGAQLLKSSAVKLLREKLLPIACLVTPNLDEAKLLTGLELSTIEDLRGAAKRLHEGYGCAVLVKGGHLRTGREAVDIFYDGKQELILTAPFARGMSTHGTGCTYSAAITACLARGMPLPKAVVTAKEFITKAIHRSPSVGKHSVLHCFWKYY